jgi:hypothetical protein
VAKLSSAYLCSLSLVFSFPHISLLFIDLIFSAGEVQTRRNKSPPPVHAAVPILNVDELCLLHPRLDQQLYLTCGELLSRSVSSA